MEFLLRALFGYGSAIVVGSFCRCGICHFNVNLMGISWSRWGWAQPHLHPFPQKSVLTVHVSSSGDCCSRNDAGNDYLVHKRLDFLWGWGSNFLWILVNLRKYVLTYWAFVGLTLLYRSSVQPLSEISARSL